MRKTETKPGETPTCTPEKTSPSHFIRQEQNQGCPGIEPSHGSLRNPASGLVVGGNCGVPATTQMLEENNDRWTSGGPLAYS